jgi:predicted nucleic acid-binding protein
MKKPTVYIETSIISFLTSRPSRDFTILWFQQMTREWWEICRNDFHLYISDAVYDEIIMGDSHASRLRMEATEGIEILVSTPEVKNLAQELMDSHSLPPKAATDALHIALSAYYGMDFLLTWNCKHIANPHLERTFGNIILQKGYRYPVISTPIQFLNQE